MAGAVKFGAYPFPPDEKRPIHIRGELIHHFIYPFDKPMFSDLNLMFVSTNRLQVCTFQLGPGGVFQPADVHAGDEVYVILDGTVTVENPIVGQTVQVKKGEVLLLPKDAWHKAYNFEQEPTRILAIIAPRAWDGDQPPDDFDESRGRYYKRPQPATSQPVSAPALGPVSGTVEHIGRWPVPGPDARSGTPRFYHIPDERKLLVVRGREFPMLMKFAVSNDLLHVGDLILPAGGVSVRISEPDIHQGDCALYVEQGPISIFLPDTLETFDVQEREVMFIPERTRYQLLNYTAGKVKAIFAIAPDL